MANLEKLIIGGKDLIQSPYIHLDAAGSDASDGTSRGVHLRWDFFRSLGETHLPKGNLAAIDGSYPAILPNAGFNKPNDFVKVYRVPYINKFPTEVDFIKDKPTRVLANNRVRIWEFDKTLTTITHTVVNTTIVVRFEDYNKYDTIKGQLGNVFNCADFLKLYNGLLTVFSKDKLFFSSQIRIKQDVPSNAITRIEGISVKENLQNGEEYLAYRKTNTFNSNSQLPESDDYPIVNDVAVMQAFGFTEYDIKAENLKYLRFDYTNAYPTNIRFETYSDFIVGNSNTSENWELVGEENGFALSLDDEIVKNRLEDTARFTINEQWPRYKAGDLNAFTVLTKNYFDLDTNKSKWTMVDGIKTGLQTYLQNSKDGSPALVNVTETFSKNADGELSGASHPINYLDLIKMVSLDYHIARMLGLGYIDTKDFTLNNVSEQYVYLSVYTTFAALERNATIGEKNHYYMTLPTSQLDSKIPDVPVVIDTTYGMKMEAESETIQLSTDEFGYIKNQRLRFININVDKTDEIEPLNSFFYKSQDFTYAYKTDPVYYGIEYQAKENLNYSDFVNPKLSFDVNFYDIRNNNEVIPLLNTEDSTVYTHIENEDGIHRYGVYAINWFSRTSGIDYTEDIETVFPTTYRLLPPFNLNAQLIQEEEPRIFTSEIEQEKLTQIIKDITNELIPNDKTIVRLTFGINDSHFSNHQIPNEIGFYFRETVPAVLGGKIKGNVLKSADNSRSTFSTTYYELSTAVEDGELPKVINPEILSTDIDKFKGSVFATTNNQFYIDNVEVEVVNGNRAKFTIFNEETTNAVETPLGSNNYEGVNAYDYPLSDEKFYTTENMQRAEAWPYKLAKKVDIINFSPTKVKIIVGQSLQEYTTKASIVKQKETHLFVEEVLGSFVTDSKLIFNKIVSGDNLNIANKQFIVNGDIARDLKLGDIVAVSDIFFNSVNNYTVVSSYSIDKKTYITVSENITEVSTKFALKFSKEVTIASINTLENSIVINGNIKNEIPLVHQEVSYLADGSSYIENVGGIFANATITAIPDKIEDSSGVLVDNPNKQSGAYTVSFTNFILTNHPDEEVEWQGGIVRIPINGKIKILEVTDISRNESTSTTLGSIKSPLELTVIDPTFDSNAPVVLTSNTDSKTLNVNFHPSYRVYLYGESGSDFTESHIYPGANDLVKKITFISAITSDSYILDSKSAFTQPATIYARKVVPPVTPGPISGPLFATRPNFYGKSTYSIDTKVDTTNGRKPYTVIFYRGSARIILEALYKQSTLNQVLTNLSNLTETDLVHFTNIWNDLVNVVLVDNDFKTYTDGGFKFPWPDNTSTFIYDATDLKGERKIYPFVDSTKKPGEIKANLKLAIQSVFVSLTEKPVEYDYIKTESQNGGRFTRASKPVIKDNNGNLLSPSKPNYDPAPMAVRFSENGNSMIRFTDYNIEGASSELYFYFAMEMSDDAKFSDASYIVGPVRLIDAASSQAPTIKSVYPELENPISGISTAVNFVVDSYLESEKIVKYRLYRATNARDAVSIRTMSLAKEVDSTSVENIDADSGAVLFSDDFSDYIANDEFLPFGDPLFYRVIALRKIFNEKYYEVESLEGDLSDLSLVEYVPSYPSDFVLTNIVDVLNPEAPEIILDSYEQDSTSLLTYKKVVLKWNKTAHNATYYLYKMSSSGNYSKIAEIKSNDKIVEFELSDDLLKENEEGQTIYHRFKVDVENSSGLLNLENKEITI